MQTIKTISISVPEPCHEDWHKMTPQAQGRHCEACQKIVIDFTSMTDRQIIEFFQNRKERTCGRFLPDQLNRSISYPKPTKPRPYRWLAAAALSGVLAAQPAAGFANSKFEKTPTEQQIIHFGFNYLTPEFAEFKGFVFDGDTPLANVSMYIQSERRYVYTDSNGYFEFTMKFDSFQNSDVVYLFAKGYQPTTFNLKRLELNPIIQITHHQGKNLTCANYAIQEDSTISIAEYDTLYTIYKDDALQPSEPFEIVYERELIIAGGVSGGISIVEFKSPQIPPGFSNYKEERTREPDALARAVDKLVNFFKRKD